MFNTIFPDTRHPVQKNRNNHDNFKQTTQLLQFCCISSKQNIFQDNFKQYLRNWHCKTAAGKPKACCKSQSVRCFCKNTTDNTRHNWELFRLNVRFIKSTYTVCNEQYLKWLYANKYKDPCWPTSNRKNTLFGSILCLVILLFPHPDKHSVQTSSGQQSVFLAARAKFPP